MSHVPRAECHCGPLCSYDRQACANGHPWGPGRVIVSWMACDCAPARAAHPEARRPGHQTVACQAAGCRSVWYKPRHEP